MRVAGEDELLDAERGVFLDPVTSETAVDQTSVGGGSFCAEIRPDSLINCHAAKTATGLIRRSRPWRRHQGRPA
ncbi:MAG TPA: hypothetical protein VMR14_06670 [Streptosporangiaceae bacterium]|nr:hypothetical protein [Streptosporangiaceae bacterium]